MRYSFKCLGEATTVFMRVQQLVYGNTYIFGVPVVSFELYKSERLQPKKKVDSQKLAY